MRKVMSELGRRGGKVLQNAKTPEERTAAARKASNARWAGVRERNDATTTTEG